MRHMERKDFYQFTQMTRDREVSLIDAQGPTVAVMPAVQAVRLAEEADLNLVKISPNAVPTVCKIMDYCKFK